MSSAPMTVSSEANGGQRPRRRSQFSLFTLLLLFVIGCVAAAWFGEKRRWLVEKRLREETEKRLMAQYLENRDLQMELGVWDNQPRGLSITDPQRVHVLNMSAVEMVTHRETARRWKVYLPPGTSWRVGVDYGSDWDEKQLRYRDCRPEIRHTYGLDGERTLDVYFFRRLDGTPAIVISGIGSTTQRILPEQAVAAVLRSGQLTEETTGQVSRESGIVSKQETFAPTGRIVLMRWHRKFSDSAKETDVAGEPLPEEYGFAIYLEEATAAWQQRQQRLPRWRIGPTPSLTE